MAAGFLLDSDVIIWQLRGHEPTRELLRELRRSDPLACSPLSVFEVWAGIRPREAEATRAVLDGLETIPVSPGIAYKAGDYWRAFRSKGITLGRADALIAATAQTQRLVLVTYNVDHYPMDDIQLYDPMPGLP